MSRPSQGRKRRAAKPIYRWTPLQQVAGYSLTAVVFLSVVLYVSQSIEMKNVAYAMRVRLERKQALIERKQELEVALLEKQRPDRVFRSAEALNLPLSARPRLEIVLKDHVGSQPGSTSGAGDEDLSWRHWLARMNQAHAMMTSARRPNTGWRGPNRSSQLLEAHEDDDES